MKTRNGSTKFPIIPDGKLELPELPFVSPAVIRKLENGKWAVDVVVYIIYDENSEVNWDKIETEDGKIEFDTPEDAFDWLMDQQNA